MPTYFHLGAGDHGFMLRTAVSVALANGINNAMTNAGGGKFKSLPPPAELLKCPKALLYPVTQVEYEDADREEKVTVAKDFTKLARMIGYDERMERACGKGFSKARQFIEI